jgi:hypothetical protein
VTGDALADDERDAVLHAVPLERAAHRIHQPRAGVCARAWCIVDRQRAAQHRGELTKAAGSIAG